jgi:hypothetical protein
MIRLKLAILALAFVFVGTAGAATGIRFVKLNPTDVARIPSQKLSCIVSKDSFLCVELGGFPRLSFYATKDGGDSDMGKFYVFRTEWSGAQMEMLSEHSRRD